jgi:hypothetical protein
MPALDLRHSRGRLSGETLSCETGVDFIIDGFAFEFLSHGHVTGEPEISLSSTDVSNNGTQVLLNHSFPGVLTIRREDGAAFSAQSFDAAEYYTSHMVAAQLNARYLSVTGTTMLGTVVQILQLDGLSDGPLGVADFQHFDLGALFVNLTESQIAGTGAITDSGQLCHRQHPVERTIARADP